MTERTVTIRGREEDVNTVLRAKGYELILYPGERDTFNIQLTDRDRDTGRAFNVKEVVSLSAIEQCKASPSYVLCKVFLGLMERLDSRTECFDRYRKSVGDSDGNET